MIPYIFIGVAALIGLIFGGFAGLLIGLVLGFALSLLVGLVVNAVHGGLVPKKTKRNVAVNFIAANAELVSHAFPELQNGDAQLTAIEQTVEQIFRRAASDNTALNLEAGWTRAAVQDAVVALMHEEPLPQRKTFLQLLGRQIERDMYPRVIDENMSID